MGCDLFAVVMWVLCSCSFACEFENVLIFCSFLFISLNMNCVNCFYLIYFRLCLFFLFFSPLLCTYIKELNFLIVNSPGERLLHHDTMFVLPIVLPPVVTQRQMFTPVSSPLPLCAGFHCISIWSASLWLFCLANTGIASCLLIYELANQLQNDGRAAGAAMDPHMATSSTQFIAHTHIYTHKTMRNKQTNKQKLAFPILLQFLAQFSLVWITLHSVWRISLNVIKNVSTVFATV